jgi:uncharacterized SAM-binding protein YcdF (DUF218 family)
MTGYRRAAITLAALVVASLLTLALGLRAAGRFLVVEDPLLDSEALYVFPGGVPKRAEHAAQLFHSGIAPKVVVSGERIRPELEVLGMPLSDAEINARVLERCGVPAEAIIVLAEGTSTWEDAQALRRWATAQTGIHHIIAVTSPAHSRRARRTLREVFRGTGIDVRVQPYQRSLVLGWWKDEETLLRVINEYIKLIYYAVAH